MKKSIIVFFAIVCIYINDSIAEEAGSTITPAMKGNSEKAIQTCEKTYQDTKDLWARLAQVKKPHVLSSSKTKEIYKDLEVNKAVFIKRMGEFTQFTNDKIQIRTAKSLSDLRDKVAAYSSNCIRFAKGLAGFVDWATTGKGPIGFESIYKEWQDEVRANKRK